MASRKRFSENGVNKKKMSKKQKAVIILAVIVALGVITFALWRAFQPIDSKHGIKDKHGVTRYYSPLTGMETTAEKTLRNVIGVMIENSPESRPQAGLTEAGIVYEAVAEGGITRFLALYQEADPELLCPVRSVRSYFLEWSVAYGASIAHVGGSGDALVMLSTGDYGADLDQSYHPTYFWREPTRYAPHDVCTTITNLRNLEKLVGAKEHDFTPFARKDSKAVEEPNATNINIPVATGPFNVDYKYDSETNKYLRYQGGEPHMDQTKGQIAPDVVIALDVNISLRNDNLHNDIYTIGTDRPVWIFQNGTVEKGIWLRGDHHSPLLIHDAEGNDIKLNRGQTWITALNDIHSVNY